MMKKFLLLAAALLFAVACSKPSDGPVIDGEMKLNHTSATMKYGDQLELKVLNLPNGASVKWNVPNDYSVFFDEETSKVSAFAIGEGEVQAIVGDVTMVCKITVVKTYDECIFVEPKFAFGADSVATKAEAVSQGFDYLETSLSKGKDSATIIYVNQDVTTELAHEYNYYIQTVAKNDQNGLYDIVVVVPSKDNKVLQSYFESFAERHYFLGKKDNLYIFLSDDKKSSIVCVGFPLNNEQTLFGLLVEYINKTDWSSAPAAIGRDTFNAKDITMFDSKVDVLNSIKNFKEAYVR